MSKRGWQSLNKWKKVPSKQNELESTEDNAVSSPEQCVQGQAKSGQGSMRQTSTRLYSISEESAGSTGQSNSEHDTTGQDTTKHPTWLSNTVDEGAQQSAMERVTDEGILYQDETGLPAGQGLIDDNATRRSSPRRGFEKESIEAIDLAVAEKCARGLNIKTHTVNVNTIKEAILEMGALQQFALKQDVIHDIMRQSAVKQCRKRDISIGTNSFGNLAPVGTMEQVTENVGVTKHITPPSASTAQVATKPGAKEPYTQGPSATRQGATKRDDLRESTLESGWMKQITTDFVAMRQYCPKPVPKQQDPMRQSTTEPSDISQATIEQGTIVQPIMETESTGQVVTGQHPTRQLTTESEAMGPDPTEYNVRTSFGTEFVAIEQVTAEDDDIRPYSTKSGDMGLNAAKNDTIRSVSIEPSIKLQIATNQDSMQQSTTETGVTGQTVNEHDTMRPLSTGSGAMVQVPIRQGTITSFNSESIGIEQTTTDNIEQAALVTKLKRSEVVATSSLPAIHISTTEPAVMSQIVIEQPLRKSTMELDAIGQASTVPGAIEQNTTGQSQGSIKLFSTEPIIMEQFTTDDKGQAAVAPKLRRSTEVGTLGLPTVRISTDEPAIMGQTPIEQPLKQSTIEVRERKKEQASIAPGAMRQIATGQGTIKEFNTKQDGIEQTATGQDVMEPVTIGQPGLEQGTIKPFSTDSISMEEPTTDDMGQAAIVTHLKRLAVVGTSGPPGIRISTTEPTVKGQTASKQSLTQSTMELGAIGQAGTERGATKQCPLGQDELRRLFPKFGSTDQATKNQYDTIQYPANYVEQSAITVYPGRSAEASGLSANISTTEPGSVGNPAGLSSLTEGTMEASGMGPFAPSSTLTQTDLYSESHQRQERLYPLRRTISRKTYTPDWIDLDRRPLPEWYDQAKVGIIVHWGLYSVPSYKSEWFWYLWKKGNKEILEFMNKMNRAGSTYQEFGAQFKAQYFNPVEWATLFAKAGAKYVVLTAKHHDGFKLFPSKSSFNWNSYNTGPKRDIVKELSKAVTDKGLKFGIYYSLYEWFNPIYEEDKKTSFKTRDYVNEIVWPDLMHLVNSYKPSILWADGDWEANEYYWKSEEFISWVYNDSPVRDDVVVNNRWGCKQTIHGDFYNRDERHNQTINDNIFTKFHKWEASITMDKQLCWCHRREMKFNEIMTIQELLLEVVSTVSCGGNILINVGPTEDGLITPLFEERLLQLGEWLEINGEAIYGSSPWKYQIDDIDDTIYYTCVKEHYDPYKPAAPPVKATDVNVVYTIFFKWPLDSIVKIRNIMAFMKETPCAVTLLGDNSNLTANVIQDEVYILLPDKAKVKSSFAWTLKFISKNSLKDDLGSIVIPLKDTALKLSKSGSKLGSRTGMKSTSKIVSRLGNTSKSGSKMSKLHLM